MLCMKIRSSLSFSISINKAFFYWSFTTNQSILVWKMQSRLTNLKMFDERIFHNMKYMKNETDILYIKHFQTRKIVLFHTAENHSAENGKLYVLLHCFRWFYDKILFNKTFQFCIPLFQYNVESLLLIFRII
jgi:hypothetical protein